MRFFLAAMLFAGAAHGQGFPYHSIEPDEFTLEREWNAPYAFVEYYNSAERSSGNGHPRELTAGDLTVQLELHITNGPEILRVIPPTGWTVVGDATISVVDGERGYVELIRGGQGM
jgi:hypothetical protein